jgi:gamma-glutamylcyclotransferase (GGCT)/AIG2-like uncharacterized protein YtfP
VNSLLFVYGTLKRGGSNHRHLEGQTFVGVACTWPGFLLYDLGGYPGIAPAPADLDGVTGEVWRVDPAALARLDVFEGVPAGLYRRDRIALQSPFADATVDAYFPVAPVTGRREIGGEWRE